MPKNEVKYWNILEPVLNGLPKSGFWVFQLLVLFLYKWPYWNIRIIGGKKSLDLEDIFSDHSVFFQNLVFIRLKKQKIIIKKIFLNQLFVSNLIQNVTLKKSGLG